MFGYVRPYKPEMKVRELEQYRSVYCGLCHALGRRYSFLTRMILSYDSTFLALLHLGLADGCMGFEKKCCPAKLFRKKTCCKANGDVDFAADCAVLLFYYKLRDTLKDAGRLKKLPALLMLPFASALHKKAARRRPEAETVVCGYIAQQSAAEQRSAGIDEAAQPTAEMMSRLLAMGSGEQANARVMGRMGYFIGKWVYLTDAADDLEQDMKSGDFNPFVRTFALKEGQPLKGAREDIRRMLNICQYEICAAFELIDFKKFKPILGNIVYLGLPAVAGEVLQGKKLKPL